MSKNTDVPPKNDEPIGLDVDIESEERYKLIDHPDPAPENRTNLHQEVPSAPPVTNGMLKADETRRDTWLQYNKGLKQKGHTPAKAITPENVDELEREYVIEEGTGGLQCQPIIAPGDPPVMYYTVWGQEDIVAVNARTGEEYWRFESGRESIVGGGIPTNRGVGIWKDKVYYLSDEMVLIAIDRFTGEEVWERSILMEDPEVGEQTPIRTYITQAPLTYDGKVIFGQSSDRAEWTEIICMDAEDGELLWHTPTYVSKDKWAADTWRYSSTAAWNGVALDPDSGTVLFHTGNADPAAFGQYRPGPNRASEGIGALDVETGEYKWTNQLCVHEVWDWDISKRPQVHDVEIDGETRRVVTTDWKGGYTATIDVETGQTLARSEPLTAVEEELRHPPLGWENREQRAPGASGGPQWPPDAFNPDTGLKYLSVTNNDEEFWSDSTWEFDPDSPAFVGGGWGGRSAIDPHPYVLAVDPVSGEIKWRYDHSDGFGTTHSGGVTTTGGGLVFHGSSGGNFVALDLDGNELWMDDTEGHIQPAPCIWDDIRRQGPSRGYVTVVSDNRIIVYTTPGRDTVELWNTASTEDDVLRPGESYDSRTVLSNDGDESVRNVSFSPIGPLGDDGEVGSITPQVEVDVDGMQFNLCTITAGPDYFWSGPTIPIDEVSQTAANVGFHGLEIWGNPDHLGDSSRAAVKESISHAIEHELEVQCFGSYLTPGEDGIDESVIREEVRITEDLGAGMIRVWPGTQEYNDHDEAHFEACVEDLQLLCDLAAERDIEVTLEKHEGTLAVNAEGCEALIEAVDRDNLGINWHALTQFTAEELFEEAKRLAPITNQLHLQSFPEQGSTNRVLLEDAYHDWGTLLRIFREEGFEGDVNHESTDDTFGYEEGIARDLQYIREELDRDESEDVEKVPVAEEHRSSQHDLQEVEPNGNVLVEWEAPVPEDIDYDQYEVSITASYVAEGGTREVESAHEALVLGPIPEGFETFSNTTAQFGTLEDETLVVNANGEELWENSGIDEYGAMYLEDGLGETGTVTVKLESQEDTFWAAVAGLVVRNDITRPGESAGYQVQSVLPDEGASFYMDTNGSGYIDSRDSPGVEGYPMWLRLEKEGTTFTGYHSTDGENWYPTGQTEIPSAEEVQDVGLIVSSKSTDTSWCEFSEFDVTDEALGLDLEPVPEELETFANTTAELGMRDGTYVIDANGFDAWESDDEYASIYLEDELEDGESVRCRVLSQQNTSDFARTGVVVKNDLDAPGASLGYAQCVVTPGVDYAFYRDTESNGFINDRISGGSTEYPSWVRLERDGDQLTAYYSTATDPGHDGTSWNEIGTQTMPEMDAALDVGMVVCSVNTDQTNFSEFESFEVY